MTNLDKLDHLLIARLREDARAPVSQLARSLGFCAPPSRAASPGCEARR
jgi:DNA-binding Lrp family transcriptional regulator